MHASTVCPNIFQVFYSRVIRDPVGNERSSGELIEFDELILADVLDLLKKGPFDALSARWGRERSVVHPNVVLVHFFEEQIKIDFTRVL